MQEHSEPVSELLEAHWPREQVIALFGDLVAGSESGDVEVQHVQLRQRSSQGTEDSPSTLDEAWAAFAAGRAIAVQIKYRFQEEFWCDTILPDSAEAKIIRSRVNVQ